MARTQPSGDFNPYNFEHRGQLAHACAVTAVQTVFGYLTTEQITTPPRAYKDAQFARQIAIHIMVHTLRVEQRHITRMQGRQRTNIHFALQAVERRLECSVFRAAYDRMAMEAATHYEGPSF